MPELADPSRLARRAERERQARKLAESLLEDKSHELYAANQALRAQTERLDQLVEARTRELQAALERAEAASRAQREFLATVSHEIRTPLQALLGISELLRSSPLGEEQREWARLLHSGGLNLKQLVDDILDLAKVEAGQLTLEPRPASLPKELNATLALFRQRATDKQLALEADIADDLDPVRVDIDTHRLRQIISNLLSNAVKFTDRGHVRLSASVTHRSQDHLHVAFKVIDTGIGMDAAAQARLFQPFIQVDGSATRRATGTGLGLSISAQLLHLMGSELKVTSSPNNGSCFHFELTLPWRPVKRTPDTGPEADDHANAFQTLSRVLVVEDQPVNVLILKRVLEQFELQVEVADNGLMGVNMACAQPFDIIMMDVQLPELDGTEATRMIRERCPSPQPYIVALTANAFDTDRQRCTEAGMDDFVAKPFSRADIQQALSRAAAQRANH